MARIKDWEKTPQAKWVPQSYRDHAGQPATLVVERATNPKAINDPDLAPIPEFAFQVYSTVALDPDYTTLCQYLSRGIDYWPRPSFEIYAPQPDVFACVEHQRREIVHRKTTNPGEGFFPGIAKAAPNPWDELPQGFLLVITSQSYRTGIFPPHYERETGPLWVSFNRSFPSRAEVDLRSRCTRGSAYVDDPIPYVNDESQLSFERDEIIVRKCQNIFYMGIDLKDVVSRSYEMDTLDETFDYGLDDDEGEPFSTEQPLPPAVVQLLKREADSLSIEDFSVDSHPEVVTITTHPAVLEPDLRYIVWITFPHPDLDITQIAQTFTSGLMKNLPSQKSIHLEFRVPLDLSLSSVVASHSDHIKSRAEMPIGAIQTVTSVLGTAQRMRVFPLTRCEAETYDSRREPYRIFAVILDRPDFLTAPGTLFFLTDGNKFKDENELVPNQDDDKEFADYNKYEVWRSVDMQAVARRLAMLSLEERPDEV